MSVSRLVRLVMAGAAVLVRPALAQQPPDTSSAPEPRTVAGRVVRASAAGAAGVRGTWVTLHRVSTDSSGPLDSVRTRADGAYRFRYLARESDSAIFFASVSYGGIAYFTSPLRGTTVSGDAAEITVFDTTSAPIPLRVRGRHLIASAASSAGSRTMVEVFELSNDTTLTRVTGPGERATWSALLPPGATDFRVGQGDITADAVNFADGRVLVFAPFAPGLRQLSFSYSVSVDSFPLSVPIDAEATVFEVLIEDPAGSATGAQLTEVSPVSVEGRNFKRFLGQDIPAGAVVTLSVPTTAPTARPRFIPTVVAAVGAAMLLALVLALARRRIRATPVSAVVERGEDPERLARAMADLDASFERRAAPTAEERAAYERERGMLKSRLAAALASRRPAS